jgi:heat shock protein HslJ
MKKFLAAALVVLAACSDSTGPNAVVGAYALASINGQGLPQIIAEDATTTVEVTGGLVTLNADGTFTDRIDFRITDDTGVSTDSDTAFGTYTVSGNNITFHADDGSTYSMARSGGTLTQSEPGITLVYER